MSWYMYSFTTFKLNSLLAQLKLFHSVLFNFLHLCITEEGMCTVNKQFQIIYCNHGHLNAVILHSSWLEWYLWWVSTHSWWSLARQLEIHFTDFAFFHWVEHHTTHRYLCYQLQVARKLLCSRCHTSQCHYKIKIKQNLSSWTVNIMDSHISSVFQSLQNTSQTRPLRIKGIQLFNCFNH